MKVMISKTKWLIIIVVLMCSMSYLNGQDYALAHQLVKSDNINDALVEYKNLVDNAVSKRTQMRGVDPVLIAEYGYVLALAKVYDVALITLDEARNNALLLPQKSVVKEVNYYIYETLLLIQYDNLSAPFLKESKAPEWITKQELQTLRTKHTTAPIINRENYKTTIARINALTGEKSLLQALVLSEELSFFYDKQSLSTIAKGDIWSELGYYEEALQCYQTVKEKTAEKDTFLYHYADQQFQTVQKKSKSSFTRFMMKYNPRFMAYLGGVFSLSSASVSARVGVYTTTQFSASLNFSYNHLYDEYVDSFLIGLSAYRRFFNILSVGLGLNQQFGNGDYTFYVAPSVGASWYIMQKKMSLDVFYNLNIPCKETTALQHNISFGVTTYF